MGETDCYPNKANVPHEQTCCFLASGVSEGGHGGMIQRNLLITHKCGSNMLNTLRRCVRRSGKRECGCIDSARPSGAPHQVRVDAPGVVPAVGARSPTPVPDSCPIPPLRIDSSAGPEYTCKALQLRSGPFRLVGTRRVGREGATQEQNLSLTKATLELFCGGVGGRAVRQRRADSTLGLEATLCWIAAARASALALA